MRVDEVTQEFVGLGFGQIDTPVLRIRCGPRLSVETHGEFGHGATGAQRHKKVVLAWSWSRTQSFPEYLESFKPCEERIELYGDDEYMQVIFFVPVMMDLGLQSSSCTTLPDFGESYCDAFTLSVLALGRSPVERRRRLAREHCVADCRDIRIILRKF